MENNKPFLEYKDKRYYFEFNRKTGKEIITYMTKSANDENVSDFDKVEEAGYLLLKGNNDISREIYGKMLDDYCKQAGNFTEIYEFLTYVVDDFLTDMGMKDGKNLKKSKSHNPYVEQKRKAKKA